MLEMANTGGKRLSHACWACPSPCPNRLAPAFPGARLRVSPIPIVLLTCCSHKLPFLEVRSFSRLRSMRPAFGDSCRVGLARKPFTMGDCFLIGNAACARTANYANNVSLRERGLPCGNGRSGGSRSESLRFGLSHQGAASLDWTEGGYSGEWYSPLGARCDLYGRPLSFFR